MDAVAKMEVRKYKQIDYSRPIFSQMPQHSHKKSDADRWTTTLSLGSDGTICAICLEEFHDGEVGLSGVTGMDKIWHGCQL